VRQDACTGEENKDSKAEEEAEGRSTHQNQRNEGEIAG